MLTPSKPPEAKCVAKPRLHKKNATRSQRNAVLSDSRCEKQGPSMHCRHAMTICSTQTGQRHAAMSMANATRFTRNFSITQACLQKEKCAYPNLCPENCLRPLVRLSLVLQSHRGDLMARVPLNDTQTFSQSPCTCKPEHMTPCQDMDLQYVS